MCGIAGFYSPSQTFSANHLHTITRRLNHRGPDAEGFYTNANHTVGLGHKRLSIIDLSQAANQPMTSQNGRYVMVYNGEVYNFKQLTALLNQHGIFCKTHSDTEVALELFVLKGADFVHLLNGMFAIAIYDTQLHRLHLYRDIIGIKPLFYYWNGTDFAFASELKALQQLPGVAHALNHEAIPYFLHIGYIPAPHTIYRHCYKLPHGYSATITPYNLSIQPCHTLPTLLHEQLLTNETQAKQTFATLLTNAVQQQMFADVPFGTFLSGGVDSSLITAIAQSLSNKPVNTFTIGFADTGFNEAHYARKVAQHLHTNHHELILTEQDALQMVERLPDIYDEPFADSSAIPTLLVSQLARRHVTVTLSGEGGDELFWGYGSYQWAYRLSNPLARWLRQPAAAVFSLMGSRYKRVAHLLRYPNTQTLPAHIHSQELYFFTLAEINRLLCPMPDAGNTTPNFALLNQHFARNLSLPEWQAMFEMTYYLPDNLLTKVDRASMFYALETRVPYLDHHIVAFALNLAPHLKIRNNTTKYLLKQLLYSYLPQRLFNRPKRGFAVPMVKWLKTDLHYLIQKYLNPDTLNTCGIVNANHVALLLHRFMQGDTYLYNRIWLLIVLHQWLCKNR